jgi:hypothetical protein
MGDTRTLSHSDARDEELVHAARRAGNDERARHTRLCRNAFVQSNHDLESLASDTTNLWSQLASPNRFVRRFVDTDQARFGNVWPSVRSVAAPNSWSAPGLRAFGDSALPVGAVARSPPILLPSSRQAVLQPDAVDRRCGSADAPPHTLQAADTLVGQVLDRLNRSVYNDSMVVVTADHGVSFTPGQSVRIASPMTYPQIVWAPLLIKYRRHRSWEHRRPRRPVDRRRADHCRCDRPPRSLAGRRHQPARSPCGSPDPSVLLVLLG